MIVKSPNFSLSLIRRVEEFLQEEIISNNYMGG
jgi:hypothetical protein